MAKDNVLRTWEGIKFRLYVPKVIDTSNKIEVHFTYTSPDGVKKQIKQSSGIDRFAKAQVYTKQANELIDACIQGLQNGYNWITKSYPEYIKLSPISTITDCVYFWLKLRKEDFEDGKIKQGEYDITNHLFDYFNQWLAKNHFANQKPEYFTKNDINSFLRTTEKDRTWSKTTYNSYNYRLNYFFKFLISERIITFNPVIDSFRYKTARLETRFKIFDDVELELVQNSLKSDPKFKDLLIATILLYTYRIRGAEQLRIKVGMFDFESGLLTMPVQIIDENGNLINTLKNGGKAVFQILQEDIEIIKDYLGSSINQPDLYLYGGHNKAGNGKRYEMFLTGRWNNFRKAYDLPTELKWYALKHTANYNASENLSPEQQRILNRHSEISTSNLYKESKVSKQIITVEEKNRF